jgi:plasmid stability protein
VRSTPFKTAIVRLIAKCLQKRHYDIMPKAITIRDVPDETGRELAARAAASGRSMQEYLLAHLIELAERPDPEVLVARLRARKEHLGTRLSREAILAHKAADRR